MGRLQIVALVVAVWVVPALALPVASASDKGGDLALVLSGEQRKCRQLALNLRALGSSVKGAVAGPSIVERLPRGAAFYALQISAGTLQRFLLVGQRVIRLTPRSLAALDPWLIKVRDQIEYEVLPARPSGLRGLGQLGANLRTLHRLLWQDLQPHLAGVDRIWISAGGLTRFIPFHALMDGSGTFVAETKHVAYLPCASRLSFGVSPTRKKTAAKSIALVPGYGPTKQPVRGAAAEVAAMNALGAAVEVWGALPQSRGAADAVRLQAALAVPNARVHFAGHGLAQLEPRGGTELIFAGGSSADIGALTQRPVRAALVVLASCQGAYAARFRDGKRLWNSSNMAEALVYAGARTVVAASWSLKNLHSADQMRSFYGTLKPQGPVAALTQAYRSQIKRLRIPHPRHWAAYAIYGAL